MRMRTPLAGLAIAALLAGGSVAEAATKSAPTQSASPAARAAAKTPSLRILLTNDDGWKAPGIRAVYASLTKAGHKVTVVAPLTSQSGMGGRKTYYGTISVTKPDVAPYAEYAGADVYAVGPGASGNGGSPADAVMFGLSEVFKAKKPDLVISGANFGQNTGRIINNSGTAGAAVEAAETGIPTIAVSNECKADYDPTDFAEPDFAASSAYITKLVRNLALTAKAKKTRLMPKGVALNVNFPVKKVKGTALVQPDWIDPIPTHYTESAPGTWEVLYSYVGHRSNTKTDVGALAHGFVSVTPVDSNFGLANRTGWVEPIIDKMN
jgi:5'/3'-nucleotidase